MFLPVSLTLLSIVIPARDEAGCIASTIQHLHLELSLKQLPHQIVVVDDGSTDAIWPILTNLSVSLPELKPLQNTGLYGFGRAIIFGNDASDARGELPDRCRCAPCYRPTWGRTGGV